MTKRKLTLIATLLLLCTILLYHTQSINASSSGRFGKSGNPATGGDTCSSCHLDQTVSPLGDAIPNVVIQGATTVLTGGEAHYQLVISGGAIANPASPNPAGGTNISASDGVLALLAGATDLKIGNLDETANHNELAHTEPKKPNEDGEVVFDFNWQAPTTPMTVTLYAVGNSVNGNGNSSGDGAKATTLVVQIVEPTDHIYLPLLIR